MTHAAASKPEAARDEVDDVDPPEAEPEADGVPDVPWLQLVARANSISRDYQQRTVEKPLARSYRAYKNQHADGSKYLGAAWRGRSRLFVPKTRSAVRKNLATAAAALFSTDDVVDMRAQYEDDARQRATAAVIKADVDHRLTRTSPKSGLPWFMLAMGACLDSQITGCCISKQYWEYEAVEKQVVEYVPYLVPETGLPMLDETGEPYLIEQTTTSRRVTRDRPMIDLFPLENASVDPAAPWHSPIQLGRWFSMQYPIGLEDARAMMRSATKNGRHSGWLEVSDDVLLMGRVESDRTGTRRVREGGSDRYEDAKSPGHLDLIWLQENFFRIDGVDWHFWSVGRHAIISEIRRVEDAYPEFGGERPYVMGVATIETHNVFPMSPVESWQPLQLELNDITNLRQDTLKRAIAPLAKAKRGKNVDLTTLQRRGQPDTVLLVDSMDDVEIISTPGPNGTAFTETSINNSMFDELAGVFSTSSVQANRQLNETVGGMRLMSGAANSVSEFDLRTWVETWVEPVIRQIAHLVKYYEDDERLLAISAHNAQVMKKEGVSPTFDDFDAVELHVRVNVGIGAADPMQKLGKLRAALDMLAPMFAELAKQGVSLDAEALVDEVMGAAGFRDGRRFFKFGEPQPAGSPPELQKVVEQAKVDRERMQLEFKEAMLRFQSEELRNRRDNETRMAIENLRTRRDLGRQVVGVHADRERRMASEGERNRDRAFGLMSANLESRRTAASAPGGPRLGSEGGAEQRIADALTRLDDGLQEVAERDALLAAALNRIAEELAQSRGGGVRPPFAITNTLQQPGPT